MNFLAIVPIVAMGGVALLFLLARIYDGNAQVGVTSRATILALVSAVFIACCVAGAGSAVQIARAGLAGTPPPTTVGTVGRIAGVVMAIALWPLSRRHAERAAIATFVIGAGASGLIGLGWRSEVLDGARIIYHLLMFACGAILAVVVAVDVAKHSEIDSRN